MGVKVIVLAIVALGSLFVLHLLAQDFVKIRKTFIMVAVNAASKLLIGKRDLSGITYTGNTTSTIQPADQPIEPDFNINWQPVLTRDPLRCALSLICQISAGAETSNDEAQAMLALIRYGISKNAPKQIIKSYDLGQQYDNYPRKCYPHYPLCPYSANTMLTILKIYTYVFNRYNGYS